MSITHEFNIWTQ